MRAARHIVSIVILGAVLSGCAASGGKNLVGQPAPLTRLTQLEGDVTSLDQYVGRGKPTVLAFWATTCSMSPRAIERVDAMAKKLRPQGVQFLAISIDKVAAIEDLRGMVKYRRMGEFTHFFSGNDVYDEAYISYRGDQIPYFVVIDGAGTIVASGHKPAVVQEYFQLG
jgi:thiol-disulfide isomerase/thioredoxin